MKINYVKCDFCKEKVFSFHRHDYKSCSCGKAFKDGGFDYIRSSTNGEIKEDEISNLISDIRESFT